MMRLTAILLVVSILLVPASCTSRPPSVLIPDDTPVPGATHVSVLTVSTRAPSSHVGEVYSGERGIGPSHKIIGVSLPPNHVRGQVEWPTKRRDPYTEFAVTSVSDVSVESGASWLEAQDGDGRLLIFVHGYNVRYSDAVYRLAQIAVDLGQGVAPVLFTWPSRGTLSSYIYDKESASFSRDALERVLDYADEADDVEEVTILAHSMGTWLTMEALRQSAIRRGAVSQKIKNVILASPDIDRDVFGQQFVALGEQRPAFTILISNDDRALRMSEILGGKIDRVGAIDIDIPDLEARLAGVQGVTIVDLSEIDVQGSMHHSKFAQSDQALDIVAETVYDAASAESAERIQGDPVRSLLITLSRSFDAPAKQSEE